jgi:hypothetical protein
MHTLKLATAASLLSLWALPGAAGEWKIDQEEMVSLDYRNSDNTASLLSIACSPDRSQVVVPVDPGTSKPDGPVALVVDTAGATRRLALKVETCGGEIACTDRHDGDVSEYLADGAGRSMALELANDAQSFAIDAPGASFKAPAQPSLFRAFAKLCRSWK